MPEIVKKTKVSFVVLSFNDAENAIGAVKSIKRLKTEHSYDIYIVDNGSWENEKKILKSIKKIKLIELDKNIGTAAYDAAIKKSNSEYIFFTGCDVELKDDMLDMLVDFLDNNKNAAQVTPKYLNFYDRKKIDLAGTWLSRSFYSGTFKNNALGNEAVEIPYMGTGLIRNSIIKKFGYLMDNDYFFYGEDVDLGLRLRLTGWKIYYMPDSIVYHKGSASRKIHTQYFLTYLMERNLLTTFFKNMEMKSIILFLPYVMLMRGIAILKDLIKLRFIGPLARISAILWIFFRFNFISKKRKIIQKLRKVKDEDIFRLFSEKYLLKQK